MIDIFKTLTDIARPVASDIMVLKAIWLESPVMLHKGRRTRRITQGDHVRIDETKMELVNCTADQPANFVITECKGMATSNFSIHVINKKTLEIKIVQL